MLSPEEQEQYQKNLDNYLDGMKLWCKKAPIVLLRVMEEFCIQERRERKQKND